MQTLTHAPAIVPESKLRVRGIEWREQALAAALLEESRGLGSEDALLSAILTRYPQARPALAFVDRGRLLEFADRELGSGLREVVRGRSDYWDDHDREAVVYSGWYSFSAG